MDELKIQDLFAKDNFAAQIYEHVFTYGTSGIIITTSNGVILDSNKAFSRLFGFSREEIVGKTPKLLLWSGHQDPNFYKEMWEDIASKGFWIGKIWNTKKNGEIVPSLMSIKKITLAEEKDSFYSAVYNEIPMGETAETPQNIKFYDINE